MEFGAHVAQLFTLLFTLAGPVKMAPTFAAISSGMTPGDRWKLAATSAAISAVGITLAVLMGKGLMSSWGVSPAALGIASGLVLAAVGLLAMLGHGDAHGARPAGPPTALSIAFPTILPPYAIGIVILFAAYLDQPGQQAGMIGAGVGLMAVNLLAMGFAQQIMRFLGYGVLQVLGAIFSILQLALGFELLLWGIGQGLGQ